MSAPRRYAERTKVPVAQSQADIQAMLIQHGASAFGSVWTPQRAAIEFALADRQYRINIPLPAPDDPEFTQRPKTHSRRPPAEAKNRYDAEIRRRWRALLLVIKSKLEAGASGIISVEEEFALFTVLPDGRTAAEIVIPAIEESYATGVVPSSIERMTGQRALPAGGD